MIRIEVDVLDPLGAESGCVGILRLAGKFSKVRREPVD